MLRFKVALNILELYRSQKLYEIMMVRSHVPMVAHGKFKSLQISVRRGFDGRFQFWFGAHVQMGPSENMGSFHGHI